MHQLVNKKTFGGNFLFYVAATLIPSLTQKITFFKIYHPNRSHGHTLNGASA